VHESVIIGDPAGVDSLFAYKVALGDGVLAVGVPRDGEKGKWAGAVNVYRRQSQGWQLEQKIFASDASAQVQLGMSLSFAANNETLAVGAPEWNTVYLFQKSGPVWQEQQKLREGAGLLGWDLEFEGDELMVGAKFGFPDGAVYFYQRAGTQWVLAQTILPPVIPATTDVRHFGGGLARDGNVLAVSDSHSLFLFHREGDRWLNYAWMKPPPPADYFAEAVALKNGRVAVPNYLFEPRSFLRDGVVYYGMAIPPPPGSADPSGPDAAIDVGTGGASGTDAQLADGAHGPDVTPPQPDALVAVMDVAPLADVGSDDARREPPDANLEDTPSEGPPPGTVDAALPSDDATMPGDVASSPDHEGDAGEALADAHDAFASDTVPSTSDPSCTCTIGSAPARRSGTPLAIVVVLALAIRTGGRRRR
jgi:hypothetical protein